MIFPDGVSGEMESSGMAPALQVGRMNIPTERATELYHWYNSTFVPNFEKVPGVIRGRRFKTVRGEDPMYSVVYEFENENVSRSPEWTAQLEADPKNAEMRALITHGPGSPSIYRKTFEL
ncbi:MAG: hypothetical protein V3S68_08605 [Dehalococcoidia bacterium]